MNNVNENFEKYKFLIIDEIIRNYGEEFRYIILERFKHILFDFSSLPTEEYVYCIHHTKDFNNSTINAILKRYDDFSRAEAKFKKKYCQLIKEYIEQNFPQVKREEINSEFIFEKILKNEIDLKRICNIIGKWENNSSNLLKKAKNFLEFCQEIQIQYRNRIIENSCLGEEIKEAVKKRFHLQLSTNSVRNLLYKTNPHAFHFYGPNNKTMSACVVKIPVMALLNRNIQSLDVCLIHEIIHQIETFGNSIGISIENKKKTNRIINEIRTQKLAIKIAKKLHHNKIFILDDPKSCRLENDSKYEKLFPLTGTFIEDYESFFNKCAIRNTPDLLELKFSKVWNFYSELLNLVYKNGMYEKELNSEIITICKTAIEDMNFYVKERNNESKKPYL